MSFQAVANQPFGNRPTGELGVMNGAGNTIPYATGPGVAISGNYNGGAYQQINVGDIVCQYDDATWGLIAIPACAVPAGATAASASAAAKTTLQQIHGAALEGAPSGGSTYGFLGIAASFRDGSNPTIPAMGSVNSRISINPRGRAKMRVVPGDMNYTNTLPAGTLIGAAVNSMSTGASSYLATPVPGYVQTSQCCNSSSSVGGNTYAGITAAGTTTPLTASEAIGRLAFDKAPNDVFVYVDFISTILEGGVQNTATST